VLCKQCESKNSLNNSVCLICSSFLEEDSSRSSAANSNSNSNLNQHHTVTYPVFGSPNNFSSYESAMPNANSNHLSAYQTSQSFAGQSNVSNVQNQNKSMNDRAHLKFRRT
jgi:hypothetical protein